MDKIILRVVAEISLEDYLPCVMGAEMYPDWPEFNFWPDEALKAQAIAARSYALWRLKEPRCGNFDLYGDARDQGYNCERRHPRSDQAVADTEGLVVTTDAPDFVARYVNLCGREECPLCRGHAGFNKRIWFDRMCQNGARTLACRGWDAAQILQFYYGKDAEVKAYEPE